MAKKQLSYLGFTAAQEILRYQRQHTKSPLPLADEPAFDAALRQLQKRPGVREVIDMLPAADDFSPGLRPRMIADMVQSTRKAAAEVMGQYRALKSDSGSTDTRLIIALNAHPEAHQILEKMVKSVTDPNYANIYPPPVRAQLVVEMLNTIAARSSPA